MHVVLRPATGRVVTVIVAVLSVVWLAGITLQYGLGTGVRVLPWFALAVWVCWATLWRPRVEVDDAGVLLVNVLRTVRLPWPSIQMVDTKWGLTLVTAYGTFQAWAAPAPGARAARRASRDEAAHLPASTYGPEGIRPGDVPTTASGDAALVIRERWEDLRDAGHLDDPQLEHERAPAVWHSVPIAGAVVLAAAGVLGVLAG